MRLFTYIVARDYGFAPNPFGGCCTLATCKPVIRRVAAVGDWVIGTGAKERYGLTGHLIYAMRVDETMDFTSYWNDPRFLQKRPVLNGSLKQLYGDNIYHRGAHGGWIQADSHHSLDRGRPNPENIERDTRVDRVLISCKFVYFGSAAPEVPKKFRPFRPAMKDLCCPRQGHRTLPHELATAFVSWLEEQQLWGLKGMPLQFRSHKRTAATGTTPGAHPPFVVSAMRRPRSRGAHR